ncbi:hypothetical protein FBZ90_106253 [Nitrospirillum pindoramense]|uniref:Uncharacterized protein n=1 Tax=Nitrospirillum amazonense TaxID=28077 RepID=A0A560H8H9_9PROT|nr:hypothetical protein FBZ90_106253 [Nitrospirillum amazonense]
MRGVPSGERPKVAKRSRNTANNVVLVDLCPLLRQGLNASPRRLELVSVLKRPGEPSGSTGARITGAAAPMSGLAVRVGHPVVNMVHGVMMVMVVVMMGAVSRPVMHHLRLGAARRHQRRQRQAEGQGQGSDPATAPGLAPGLSGGRRTTGGGAGQDGHDLNPSDRNSSRCFRACSEDRPKVAKKRRAAGFNKTIPGRATPPGPKR